MLRQQWDIITAIAKRWNHTRQDGETIIEIFSKRSSFDKPEQIPVRGGNNSDVDLYGPSASNRFDFSFLNHAQKLRLEVWGRIGNLVQKQRAAVGLFEESFFG